MYWGCELPKVYSHSNPSVTWYYMYRRRLGVSQSSKEQAKFCHLFVKPVCPYFKYGIASYQGWIVHMCDFIFALIKAGWTQSPIISSKILGARAKFLDTVATLHVRFVHSCVVVIPLLLVLTIFHYWFPCFSISFWHPVTRLIHVVWLLKRWILIYCCLLSFLLPLTAEDKVRSLVNPRGICLEQSGTVMCFCMST